MELEQIVEIESKWHKIVERNFPTHRIGTGGSAGIHFHAEFWRRNRRTEYFYDDWKGSFFHLTDYRALFSIINSRTIRLYNLHNSNDPRELYSLELWEPTNEQIEYRKENIFTFSFCPIDKLANSAIWEYGNLAIIFNIENNPEEWDNFHIAGIKYKPNVRFETYKDETNALRAEYPGSEFDLELEQLMAFHKDDTWKEECEVRILTKRKWEGYHEDIINRKADFKITKHRCGVTRYFEVPLWVDNDSPEFSIAYGEEPERDRRQKLPDDHFKTHPKIVLKEIVFGANSKMTQASLEDNLAEIEDIIRMNLGYKVPVRRELHQIGQNT